MSTCTDVLCSLIKEERTRTGGKGVTQDAPARDVPFDLDQVSN